MFTSQNAERSGRFQADQSCRIQRGTTQSVYCSTYCNPLAPPPSPVTSPIFVTCNSSCSGTCNIPNAAMEVDFEMPESEISE